LRDFHASRLRLFDASNADVLAVETIPSVVEAGVLVDLLAECDLPAWVSFSCKDDTCLVDGTPVAEVAGLYRNHPTVVAVGLNCTPPQFAPELIRKIRGAVPDKAVAAYPNSGETYSAEDNAWFGTVTPGDCASAARAWITAGAKIVGGCCRMGPEHIRAMRRALS
jgi:homocysteine S-methyltransferase